jgi:hypothetical protein
MNSKEDYAFSVTGIGSMPLSAFFKLSSKHMCGVWGQIQPNRKRMSYFIFLAPSMMPVASNSISSVFENVSYTKLTDPE